MLCPLYDDLREGKESNIKSKCADYELLTKDEKILVILGSNNINVIIVLSKLIDVDI